MKNAHHHLQARKTLHKLPTTVFCHTWVDSYMLQYKKKIYYNSTTV